jgi:hypothetical protein
MLQTGRRRQFPPLIGRQIHGNNEQDLSFAVPVYGFFTAS